MSVSEASDAAAPGCCLHGPDTDARREQAWGEGYLAGGRGEGRNRGGAGGPGLISQEAEARRRRPEVAEASGGSSRSVRSERAARRSESCTGPYAAASACRTSTSSSGSSMRISKVRARGTRGGGWGGSWFPSAPPAIFPSLPPLRAARRSPHQACALSSRDHPACLRARQGWGQRARACTHARRS